MNPIPSPFPRSRPRLVCRVARVWRSLVGQAGSGHIASCTDCRAYFQAGDALEAALRRDATQLSRAAMADDTGLERRILQAVRSSTPPAASSPSISRAWSGAWTACAAAVAVAIMMVFLQRRPDTAQSSLTAEPVSAKDAMIIVDTVQSLSDQLVDSVIPSAGALVANNPLQQEFDSVYSDMRSALNFLAVNFLPSSNPPAPAPVNSTI